MHFPQYLKSSFLYYLYCQFQYLDQVDDPKENLLRVNNASAAQVSPHSSSASSTRGRIQKVLSRPFAQNLLFYVASIGWGCIGLAYCQTGTIDMATLFQSPYIVIHQMFLPIMWSQIDFCFYGGIVATFCAYASLVFNPIPEQRYKMTLKDSGRLAICKIELSNADSEKIITFRGRYKNKFFVTVLVFDLLAMLYFYAFVWYQGLYRVHPIDVLFWLVLFPRLIFDIIYGLLGIMAFVLLSSKYLQIRLNSILSSMIALNRRILKEDCSFGPVWLEYTKLQAQLLSLCVDIEVCTHFWSPYLSIMVPFFVWGQAYLSYVLFFIDSVPFVQKYIVFIAVVEFYLVLFLMIDQCARMVKLNQRILRENRRFFFNIQQGRLHKRRITSRKLLLAESMQISKRLHSFAFHLFGNYRITSKTFHMVISCMSTFFLLVIKGQRIKKNSSLI